MKIIFSLALALISSVTFAQINNDFSLANADQVTFTKNTLDKTDETSKHLNFSAFDAEFNLVLEPNNDLMNLYSSERKDIKLYIGKIEGNDASWARLSVIKNKYTGAIFDGEELFLIDVSKNINDALTNNKNMLDVNTVIYKASDVSTDLSCASHGDHEAQFSYSNLLKNAKQNLSDSVNSSPTSEEGFATAAATAMQQINLRIVADIQYATSSSELTAQEQVISQMNIVNGIFSEQVGVQFGITEIEVLNDNGNLTSSNASELLGQFRTFVGNDNPGLAHLFTGRNIDGGTVGIAFVNAICRNAGVGLTEAGGRGTFGALTAAHEFGHNFGAPHDNETGSICASTPNGFLMNPSLNGSDQFSQCSLSQIANTVANAQCLIPVDNTPTEPAPTCDFSIDFANNDNDFEFSSTSSPLYSTGTVSNDGLNTTLGGVDSTVITDIDGVWSRECLSESSRNVTFELDAELTQSPEYEANEFSQIALRVNGNTTVLDTLTGDGNGGPSLTSGNQQYQINAQLNPGINTVELICFNNQKTFANEITECNFNSLETSDSIPELCFPVVNQNDNISTICF